MNVWGFIAQSFLLSLFHCLSMTRFSSLGKLASVAQLDAQPTGDQEVAGLTQVRSATFFCGD